MFFASNSSGDMLDPKDVFACLNHINSDSLPPPAHPLGYLTSDNRDAWAAARQQLAQDNREQLDAIDSAMFNLVLDDVESDGDPKKMAKIFLHGNGLNRYNFRPIYFFC